MSLINDALRRAEDDKHRNGQADGPEAGPGPLYVPAPVKHRPPLISSRTLIIVALALAGSSFAWGMLKCTGLVPSLPAPAQAGLPTCPAIPASARPESPAPSADAEAAFAKTIDHLTYYDPAAGRPSSPGLAEAQAAADAATSQPGEPRTPTAQARPAAPRKKQAELAAYRVNGIMYGAVDATAIISGHMVRVGDLIGDGKVVDIRPEWVDLEIAGNRVRLRM